MAPPKRDGSANSGTIFENRHVEVEQLRLPRDRERDVSAAGDDQARARRHRLDQHLMLVVERDDTRRAVPQLIDGHRHEARIGRRLAERAGHAAGGVDEQPSGVREVAPAAAQARDNRDRRAAGRGVDQRRQHRAAAGVERVGPALGENPHRAAADEPGVPRELFGELVRAQRLAALRDHLAGRVDGVGLDAAAAERPGRTGAQVVGHDELGPGHLRRAALRADDRRDGDAMAVLLEIAEARVQRGGHHSRSLVTSMSLRMPGSVTSRYSRSIPRVVSRPLRFERALAIRISLPSARGNARG